MRSDLQKQNDIKFAEISTSEPISPSAHAGNVSLAVSDGLPEALTKQFQKLRLNGPKLATYIEISRDMWTPELDTKSIRPEPLSILNSTVESGVLLQEIRAGGTIEGVDRKTAIGYMSLVTGWLMDDESKQDIHFLLSKRTAESEISNGDVMFAIIAREIVETISPGVGLSGPRSQEWSNLAKGKNPLVRQIAAFLLPHLTSDFGNRSKFILAYGEEREAAIIKTLTANIRHMPMVQADELLSKLAALQKQSGNLDGAAYLENQLSLTK